MRVSCLLSFCATQTMSLWSAAKSGKAGLVKLMLTRGEKVNGTFAEVRLVNFTMCYNVIM